MFNFLGGAPLFFRLFFLIIFSIVIYKFIQAAVRYVQNASSPILQAKAKVIAKRFHVSRHAHHHDNHVHHSTSTRYYTTFELENGERIELVMNGRQYGLLVEGDEGLLTYQGEWYKDFERV
jgi:hypothetical protein